MFLIHMVGTGWILVWYHTNINYYKYITLKNLEVQTCSIFMLLKIFGAPL